MFCLYTCSLNFSIYFLSDIYVWDVVAEIVKLCTYPSPRNPFAIDFDYFTMLPLSEQVLATAAMVNLLQKILIHTPDQKMYAGQGMYRFSCKLDMLCV